MTVTAPTPARSDEQRAEALANANRNRLAQSAFKRELGGMVRHDALRKLADTLELMPVPEELAQAKVHKLLLSCPRLGESKVGWIMRAARVSEAKRLGGITFRQRAALADELRLIADRWEQT